MSKTAASVGILVCACVWLAACAGDEDEAAAVDGSAPADAWRADGDGGRVGPDVGAASDGGRADADAADGGRADADAADGGRADADGGRVEADGGPVELDAGAPDPDAGAPVAALRGLFDVREHGARGDGAADDTAAIRDAIAAADAAGGGVVYLPAGRYRVREAITVGGAVTLAGEGFEPPRGGALAGSWLLVDAALLGADAITLADAGAAVRDLGIWHEQAPPGPGWQPRAFGWAVHMGHPDTLVRHVWLANPTLGIRGIGRVTIEDVQGQPITTGIRIEYAYDVVRLRRIRFNWTADGGPVWSSAPEVTRHLGTAIESLRNDNPLVADVRVAGYAVGIRFGENEAQPPHRPPGPTSKFSLMDTRVHDAQRCVVVDGRNTTGRFARFWGLRCGVTGIWMTGEGSVITAADLDLRGTTGNAVRVEADGAHFLVNQLTVRDWDGAGRGFPALEAAHRGATVKVGLFRSLEGSASPHTGGPGRVQVDGDARNAAFDLRMPAPTAVPEGRFRPAAARTDVTRHGARGDGRTDDTAAIQAALDSVAGGTVLLPAGDYVVGGTIRVPRGVALVGVGWNVTGSRGARLRVPEGSRSDVVVLGDGATLENVAFRWDHGPIGAGWDAPAPFGWAIRVTGTDVVVRDVFLLNPTRGIDVTSDGRGPVLIDRVFGSPIAVGLRLDTAAAVRVNDVHFWPFWHSCFLDCPAGSAGALVNQHILTRGVAFQLDRSAGAEVSNVFSIGYAIGLHLASGQGGRGNTDLRLWNADQDIFGARGYLVSGAGTSATFANWSGQGHPPNAVTGVWVEPSARDGRVDGYNGDLRIFSGNAVRSDAPGARVRVNLVRLEAWDGSRRGFPAVEGAAAGPETWMNGR